MARFSFGDTVAIAALEALGAADGWTAALVALSVTAIVAAPQSTRPKSLAARHNAPAVERLTARAPQVSQPPTLPPSMRMSIIL